jgi:hypothetical protein
MVLLVPDVAATGLAPVFCTGVALTSGLGDSSAPIGDGEAVDGTVESFGAGMTVTTGFGEDVRRTRVGEGDGGFGLGLGLSAAGDRLGVGSGGMTPVGELVACGRPVLAGDGFGVALAAGVAAAFGVGDGVGAAAAAGPSRTVGVNATATIPRTSGRRTSGTR